MSERGGTSAMDHSKTIIRHFDYRANRLQTVLLTCLVAAGVGLFWYFALFYDRPVDARGFHFTARQFRILAGIMGTVTPIGLAMMLWMCVSSFRLTRRVALTADSIILPKPSRSGMSQDEIEIPYRSIASVSVEPFMTGTKVLLIVYDERGIKTVMIPSNMFPDRRQFESLGALLNAAVATGHHQPR